MLGATLENRASAITDQGSRRRLLQRPWCLESFLREWCALYTRCAPTFREKQCCFPGQIQCNRASRAPWVYTHGTEWL